MMSIQQSGINFLLSRLETTTRHVSLTDGFDFLEAKLVTKLIVGIVDLIQELQEFISCVAIDDCIKLVDVDEHNCHLAFFVGEVLLPRSNFVSNQRWYQNVEDGLKFQETPHFSMAINKLGLLLEFLNVNVSGPNNGCEYSDESTKCGHEGTELILV